MGKRSKRSAAVDSAAGDKAGTASGSGATSLSMQPAGLVKKLKTGEPEKPGTSNPPSDKRSPESDPLEALSTDKPTASDKPPRAKKGGAGEICCVRAADFFKLIRVNKRSLVTFDRVKMASLVARAELLNVKGGAQSVSGGQKAKANLARASTVAQVTEEEVVSVKIHSLETALAEKSKNEASLAEQLACLVSHVRSLEKRLGPATEEPSSPEGVEMEEE